MEQIAIDDISNLLYSISIKYNLDLDLLRDRYLPTHRKKKRFDLNELIKIKIKNKKNQTDSQSQIQQNNPRTPITPIKLNNILDVMLEYGLMVCSF